VRTKPGRPKKARRKEEGEEMHPYKVTRKGLAVKCGKCYQWGHNARTCKAPENPKRRIYSKKANKRAVDTDAAPNRRQKLNVSGKKITKCLYILTCKGQESYLIFCFNIY
jgi:hypothetical protein